MWTYWLLFLVPAIASLGPDRAMYLPNGLPRVGLSIPWILLAVLLSLVIGYRYEVGGDWNTYLEYLFNVQDRPVEEIFELGDPGYQLVNWVCAELDLGIYGVNVFGGAIFSAGLLVFCRTLPRPWLALAVAVPYLVIVVGMGYSRQGIALGFAMLGLVALERRALVWFLFWVLLGATFHKSGVLLLPIAALSATRNKWLTVLLVGVVGLIAYDALLDAHVDALVESYIQAEYQSEGALVRLTMNSLPALILLFWWHRFQFGAAGKSMAPVWRWFAYLAIALLLALFIVPSSTALDRLGLYLLPLQLVVFSHLPDVLGKPGSRNADWVAVVLGYYASVQFVWLNFASHAEAWLPYQLYWLVN